jgi:hypothetical protein
MGSGAEPRDASVRLEKPGLLARIAGFVAAIVVVAPALVISGFFAVYKGCESEGGRSTSWLCDQPMHALLTPLEVALFLAALAPFLGAALFAEGRGQRWLYIGVGVAVLAVLAQIAVSGPQEGLLN